MPLTVVTFLHIIRLWYKKNIEIVYNISFIIYYVKYNHRVLKIYIFVTITDGLMSDLICHCEIMCH